MLALQSDRLDYLGHAAVDVSVNGDLKSEIVFKNHRASWKRGLRNIVSNREDLTRTFELQLTIVL